MSQLPQGWSEVRLDSISEIVTGKTPSKKEEDNFGGKIPFIKPGDIHNQGYINSTVETITEKGAELVPSIPKGSITVTCIGNLGRVAIAKEKSATNQQINTAIPNETVESKYLFHYLRTIREWMENEASATTVAIINKTKFSAAPIRLPPSKEEQKLIADKLDSVLAKVEAAQARLDKIPTLLKRFRQSVLAAATSGELTKDWRENHCELTNKMAGVFITDYDGNKLGELPIEWGYVSFKDAAEIKSNLVDPKETPDAIHLAPNHIEANSGRILELVTVEKDGVKSNKHRFFSGQIVYSKIRPYLNKVCAVDFEGLCSADMYPIESKLNREYLLYVMLSDQFVHFTSQQQGRVVLPKINQKALKKIPVPVPPEAEQVEIARLVSEFLAKAEVIEMQYKAAKLRVDKLTQSILARAFSGKLFSPISEDEREVVAVKMKSSQPKPDDVKVTLVGEKEVSEKSGSVPESKEVYSPVVENQFEQTGEVFKLLKSKNKGMSAQALFDALTGNTFSAIDDLFSELKSLIEHKVVIQSGEGENSTFKVTKK
ncbi:restriction endonuclease subunit S [Marinomonas arenicola]|uniref:restriction endonuclease subunit S n=1 Tax=Marinomonas TaxID=28253 RepID=UPI001054E11D|nr:restriction endonuclease subunit S [Marinomonas sp. KMM3893]